MGSEDRAVAGGTAASESVCRVSEVSAEAAAVAVILAAAIPVAVIQAVAILAAVIPVADALGERTMEMRIPASR
jgi:hypothetical protein